MRLANLWRSSCTTMAFRKTAQYVTISIHASLYVTLLVKAAKTSVSSVLVLLMILILEKLKYMMLCELLK